MISSQIYEMHLIEEHTFSEEKLTFVFAFSGEKRARATIDYITGKANISNVILIYYGTIEQKDYEGFVDVKKVQLVKAETNPIVFLQNIKSVDRKIWACKVLVDISCIRIPEMFTLMKYIKTINARAQFEVAYSLPYDYVFAKEPFTSYRSYQGDLIMYEPIGYSGRTGERKKGKLFLFMGFEGALGLKVIENCDYSSLTLINNLPSFYPKYKDISVINNYELMARKHVYKYSPANNPFETYNFLNEEIEKEEPICLAPLSTKPVALGVCLYAIEHGNVRIVYPVSKEYNVKNTLDTYSTYIYHIDFC